MSRHFGLHYNVEEMRQAVRTLHVRALLGCTCGVDVNIHDCNAGACGCGACVVAMHARALEARVHQPPSPLTYDRRDLRFCQIEQMRLLDKMLARWNRAAARDRREEEARARRRAFRVVR